MAMGFTPVEDDLYREIILDHYRRPRHAGRVNHPDATVEASNPLCGDEITLTVRRDDGKLAEVAFEGQGCSISLASASMLCDSVTGLEADAADRLAQSFRDMLIAGGPPVDVGDLEALQGVKAYPVRVKCATLAWNALLQAIRGAPVEESTQLEEAHDDRGGA